MRSILLAALLGGILSAPLALASNDEPPWVKVDGAGQVYLHLQNDGSVLAYLEKNGCAGLQRERTAVAILCGGPDQRVYPI